MLVVADSTPLHYLILIGEIDLLRSLYGRITIPAAVAHELSHHRTPAAVRAWIAQRPPWTAVAHRQPTTSLLFGTLGIGEREAIALAKESIGSLLLTDDLKARVAAESLGIQVVPTIRILSTAGDLSLVDFNDALHRLQQTNFRISRKVIDRIPNSRTE